MSLTNAFETHTLNYLLNATSVTRPTAWYVGLFTADPTDTGSLSNEISGNSYARRPVAFSVSGAVATNSAAVEFAAAGSGSAVAVMNEKGVVLKKWKVKQKPEDYERMLVEISLPGGGPGGPGGGAGAPPPESFFAASMR